MPVAHDAGGIFGQTINQTPRLLLRFGPHDLLDAGDAAFAQGSPHRAARAQDEAMQPVRRMRIIFAQAVINQHRQA